MGMWIYRRLGDGTFARVTVKAYEEFFFKETGTLPGDSDGFVCLITVLVFMENRKPTGDSRAWFVKHKLDANGRLDEGHSDDASHAMINMAFGDSNIPGADTGVLSSKMAERRVEVMHSWKPTDQESDWLYRELASRGVKEIWFPGPTWRHVDLGNVYNGPKK